MTRLNHLHNNRPSYVLTVIHQQMVLPLSGIHYLYLANHHLLSEILPVCLHLTDCEEENLLLEALFLNASYFG